MFDSISGLPLHPLVIHLVVVAVPLCLVLAVLFAIPRTRNWARWALGLVAVGTVAVTFVAKESGEALETAMKIVPGRDPVGVLIAQHSQLATQLFYITIGFAVVAVVSVFVVGPKAKPTDPTPPPPSTGRRVLDLVLVIALVGLAAVAAFWVYRVGDLGARAAWNPTGQQNYDSTR